MFESGAPSLGSVSAAAAGPRCQAASMAFASTANAAAASKAGSTSGTPSAAAAAGVIPNLAAAADDDEPNWALLKFAAPAAASLALGTIGVCYSLALQNGHLPKGATTPPISLFGVSNPEYRIYSVGMTTVAGIFVSSKLTTNLALSVVCGLYGVSEHRLLVVTVARPLNAWLVKAAAPSLQDDISPIYTSGLVAFAGLAIHGIIPLQEDIVQIIGGRRDLEVKTYLKTY